MVKGDVIISIAACGCCSTGVFLSGRMNMASLGEVREVGDSERWQ